jgi:hypothetical protein
MSAVILCILTFQAQPQVFGWLPQGFIPIITQYMQKMGSAHTMKFVGHNCVPQIILQTDVHTTLKHGEILCSLKQVYLKKLTRRLFLFHGKRTKVGAHTD